MKLIKKIVLLLLTTGTSITTLLSQDKFEKESRISSKEVPEVALEFINHIQNHNHVKWYYEQSNSGSSIEAKFISNKNKYSIEFDTDGKIEDIEIIIDWSQIEKSNQKRIIGAMDSLFTKYGLCKIQIQYTGEKDTLLKLANGVNPDESYQTKYEMIVKGRKMGRPNLYEITFSEEGKLINISKVKFKNSDNLEY